jgi:predicted GNAT family N-acyltransferase
VIEEVPLADIFELRWSVLRPGLPRETASFPGDQAPGAFHLAARDAAGTVVCCASFAPEPLDGTPAWRLRGMATAPGLRGQGIGARLLDDGLARVVDRGGKLLWCNARAAALSFYERRGFTRYSDLFEIPDVGPHYILVQILVLDLAPGSPKEP